MVLIILASYNRGHLIKETLKSICSQTYENWLCFITDDNSFDGTENIIQEFIKKDERFRFFKKPSNYKPGLSGTRNFGLDLAESTNADYIQLFDDDDIMHPCKLEYQLEPFQRNKNLDFTICKFDKLIETKNNTWSKETPDFKWPDKNHLGESILTGELVINSLGPIWRKDVLTKYRFDERLNYAEEWVLFTQIAFKEKPKYEVINKYLFTYRKHRNSLTLGPDILMEKKKSSFICNIILAEFLYENQAHTAVSIRFFAQRFLIGGYENSFYEKLINYVHSNKDDFSPNFLYGLQLARYISLFHQKLIGGLLNRI